MSRKVRKYKTTLIRQQEIIKAAGNVIVKYGSEYLTIRRIAKEVGIAEGTIYKHVKSKKEILSLLVDYIGDMLIETIEKSRTTDNNALEILDNIIKQQMAVIAETNGMAFKVIAEIVSLGDSQLNKQVDDIRHRYIDLIKDTLKYI